MIDWIQNLLSNQLVNPNALDPKIRQSLLQAIKDCRELYAQAAGICVTECPHRLTMPADRFEKQMDDLHRGLLIKTLIEVAWCDRHFTEGEKEAAQLILKHVWNIEVCDQRLKSSLQSIVDQTDTLCWEELLRPFLEIPELRELRVPVMNVCIKLANLVAKADNQVSADELLKLESIRRQLKELHNNAKQNKRKTDAIANPKPSIRLDDHLVDVIHQATKRPSSDKSGSKQAYASQPITGRGNARQQTGVEPRKDSIEVPSSPAHLTEEERKKRFQEGMKELDEMIGLESIKADIRRLVDLIKMQQSREKMGLPIPKISLHTVFTGNPGTGKTTVSRIVGKLLCGLGLLDQGHTIEADRSTLVAQYAGQTGPKVQECVDKALDGVLFIDEAYSLVADKGEDAFGTEAVQVLLKRIEDDRDRLVVILAGYPAPMDRMLKSNPGLTSRFQRKLEFPDYSAEEMLKIYQNLCRRYRFRMTVATRDKLLQGLRDLVAKKDQHFGNGRTVRNLFENSIQKMATRVVNTLPLTEEVLTTLRPEDIDFAEGEESLAKEV